MIPLGRGSCIIFSLSLKLLGLVKICLNETYSRVLVGKHLSDLFPVKNGLKQGDVSSPLFFNLTLEYAIWMVQVNKKGLKLNNAHQFRFTLMMLTLCRSNLNPYFMGRKGAFFFSGHLNLRTYQYV
jgi:hypothetical protein